MTNKQGSVKYCYMCGKELNHLQQAVISPDPIDYLYKAVFKDK